MGKNWRQIFVRPPSKDTDPTPLHHELVLLAAAHVISSGENGTYKPDEEGLFEVRILADRYSNTAMARGILGLYGYVPVREMLHDGNKVDIIEHEIPSPSDFQGRRK